MTDWWPARGSIARLRSYHGQDPGLTARVGHVDFTRSYGNVTVKIIRPGAYSRS
jgi:hypothetical protein